MLGVTFYGSKGDGFLLENKKKPYGYKAQLAREAAEFRQSRFLDENGEYHPHYIARALQQADALRASNASRSGALGLQWEEIGPNNIGGRVRGMVLDKRDPNRKTLYVGGVAGGLWKSTDGADSWSYIPLPDVLSISCMAQASNGTIYIGTGEGLAQIIGTRYNSGSVGNGIYKLTGNDVIEHLASTKQSSSLNLVSTNTWSEVNRIAIDPNDPNHLFAGTGGGLQESKDGGQTWTPVTDVKTQAGGNVNAGTLSPVADVDFSADGQYVYASVGGGTGVNLIKSDNAGLSWVTVPTSNNNAQPLGSPSFLPQYTQTKGRIEITTAKSNPAVAYLSIANAQGGGFHGYKTSDNGTTWQKIGEAGATFNPFGDNGQGWYDNIIAVNPFNEDHVFMGGIQKFSYSSGSGWKLMTIYFGEPSNPNWVHADIHEVIFDDTDSNIVYVGCDGGVFKSTQAYDRFPNPPFYAKNRNLAITQAYSVAAGPRGDAMCGNQDNGTTYVPFNLNSRGSAKSIRGGDGVSTEISTIDENVFIYGVYFGDIVRSNNKGVGGSYFYDNAIDPNGGNSPTRCGQTNNTRFITNFYLEETFEARNSAETVTFVADKNYNAGDIVEVTSKTKAKFKEVLSSAISQGASIQFPDRIKSRFFLPTNCGLWMTPDILDFGGSPRWFRIQNNINPNALSQSFSGDTLYYASGSTVYRISNMNSIPFDSALVKSGSAFTLWNKMGSSPFSRVVANNGGRTIEGLYVDRNNSRHLLACFAGFSSSATGNNVYRSLDAGQTWTNISNNLPNVPAYNCVIDANDPDHYIVGTEIGVFSSSDGGATWNEENTSIGRVPTFAVRQLRYIGSDCYMLYLGTHGRGMWRSSTLLKSGCELNALGIKDNESKADINSLGLYPIPMASNATIELELTKSDKVTFRVVDLPGRLVKEIKVGQVSEGKQTFNLDVSSLSEGNYILAVTLDSGRTFSKAFTVKR